MSHKMTRQFRCFTELSVAIPSTMIKANLPRLIFSEEIKVQQSHFKMTTRIFDIYVRQAKTSTRPETASHDVYVR